MEEFKKLGLVHTDAEECVPVADYSKIIDFESGVA